MTEESAVGSPHAESWRLPEDEGDWAVGAPPAPTGPFDFDGMAAQALAEHEQPHDECRAPILHRVIELVRGASEQAAPLDVLTLDEWKSVYAVMETEGFSEIAEKVRLARLGSAPSRSEPQEEPR